jgi:glyceraldehyde-3-phosphate dehydrogenase (NAD(P))
VKTTPKRIPVALVGFGSQGRRVAEAISRQEDMELVGVALSQPDLSAHLASRIGYPVYFTDSKSARLFKKSEISCQGSIEILISKAKVIVDCTPSGIGKQNKEKFYQKFGVKAIFQAGEDPTIASVPTFISLIDYEKARKAMFVRLASPFATALTRTLLPLQKGFGVKRVACTFVRTGSETMRAHQGPVDTLIPEPPRAMQSIKMELSRMLGTVEVFLSSIKVPSILLDTQSVFVELTNQTSANAVAELLARTPRVVMLSSERGLFSTDTVFEFFRRIRPFSGDIYEVCVWKEQIEVQGHRIKFTQTLDPHSVHIPEAIDAIRAMTTKISFSESLRRTDKSLCIMKGSF